MNTNNKKNLKNANHGDRYAKGDFIDQRILQFKAGEELATKSDGDVAELVREFLVAQAPNAIAHELLRSAVSRLERSAGGPIPRDPDAPDFEGEAA